VGPLQQRGGNDNPGGVSSIDNWVKLGESNIWLRWEYVASERLRCLVMYTNMQGGLPKPGYPPWNQAADLYFEAREFLPMWNSLACYDPTNTYVHPAPDPYTLKDAHDEMDERCGLSKPLKACIMICRLDSNFLVAGCAGGKALREALCKLGLAAACFAHNFLNAEVTWAEPPTTELIAHVVHEFRTVFE